MDMVVLEAARSEPQNNSLRPQPRVHRLLLQGSPPLPLLGDRARRSSRARGVALVLVVDDSAHAREMYSEYLRHRGFSVLMAADGSQAIQVAVTARPDVIVMDLAMPNMSGVTATQWLKRHPRTRNIPVVILTGYPYKAIEEGALEAGAAMLLTKPCLPEDLEGHVRSLLERPAGPS
jgi:two-component system cell cycle response regulator DivK